MLNKKEYMRNWRKNNKDKKKVSDRKYYERNKEKIKKYTNNWYMVSGRREKATKERLQLKQQVFAYYGNKCKCIKCPETNTNFLTIDHVNNDGYKHRKEIKVRGGGTKFYKWIIANNFPNTLQLMCWNCNLGKSKNNGICFHSV